MSKGILNTLRYDGGRAAIFRSIGCIGDGLSAGELEYDQKGIKGFWDCPAYSYGKFMEYTLHNHVGVFARGGLTAAQLYAEADRQTSPVEEINRLFSPQHLMQAYIIALGVNDLLHGGRIGDAETDIRLDGWEHNSPTFVGAYAKIIQRLQALQPGAKFFLVSMPRELPGAQGEGRGDDTARRHLKAMEGIASRLKNCFVIDLYHEAPAYDRAFRQKYFLCGHMNALGYQQTAWYLMTYIHHIIEENPQAFADVPFIGSAYRPATAATRRLEETRQIINGKTSEYIQWLDTDGDIINASDGGMLFVNGRYYWYGMKLRALPLAPRGMGGQTTTEGVVMYSSEDLYRWKKEGIVLACSSDPADPLCAPMRMERPKILFNGKTHQYVMWFHYVKAPGDHGNTPGTAEAGVAVADRVEGPYRFLGATRPIDQQGLVRDCTLYQDRDGSAYFIYDRQVATDRCLHIVRLSEDYLSFTDEYRRIDVACWREAAAVTFHDGYYYMITSDLTSWKTNQALYFRSTSLMGDWVCMGAACVGEDAYRTFESQSTYIFPVVGRDLVIHMAERHNTEDFEKCSYIWLPIEFSKDHTLRLRYKEAWRIEEESSITGEERGEQGG